MAGKKDSICLTFNSPAILAFALICVLALVANLLTGGYANQLVFSVYRASLLDPLTYVRFFGHVLGHSGIEHLINNMMMLLLVGPIVEDRFGTRCTIIVMVVTAVVTGLIYFIFFPHSALLGASGIVFAFILLSAATGFRRKEIPLTFILVAVLYLGEQIMQMFSADNVSQITHIAGGLVGAVFGFLWRKK